MKKLVSAIAIMTLTFSVSGQRSVDALFNRYADNDGFVTVTFSGDLLKLVKTLCDDDERDNDGWPSDITTVRILIQEDKGMKVGNFYDLVEREIDRGNYEEFMRVRESHQDLVMLVRTAGRSIKEFLVIAGGDDNLLIQVKGNMTFREARKFSEMVKEDNGTGAVKSYN